MFLVWAKAVEQRGAVSVCVVSQCLEQRGISFPLAEGREQWSCASQPVVCTACGCLVYRVVCTCVSVCECVFPPRLADEETALLSHDWQPGPMPHWSLALGIFLIKHSHFYSIWDPTENTVPFRLTSCGAAVLQRISLRDAWNNINYSWRIGLIFVWSVKFEAK